MVAVLDRAKGTQRTPEELAEEAFRLESVEAGFPGGKQDQFAAALGGVLRLDFAGDRVGVRRLQPDPGFLAELADHIIICYTGMSRVSSRTIERVMQAYSRQDRPVVSALFAMVDIAEAMTEALQSSDLSRVGTLLSENWRRQLELDPEMRTDAMGRLEAAMRDARVLGGKAAGAGAGGSMFFLASDRTRALEAARSTGSRVIPCRWASEGVRSECP
jgi:D-glycero-alpha-D-manno-heptose-7-phosphate kinase